MIEIEHHGAVNGVAGSCHELRFLQAKKGLSHQNNQSTKGVDPLGSSHQNNQSTKGSDPLGSDPNHRPAPDSHAGILIDCGLFQGQDATSRSSTSDLAIDFPIGHIRALVVTHGHIDHVGRIPYLLAAGFDGTILLGIAL